VRLAALLLFVLISATGTHAGTNSPLPASPSTGYRDFCDALKHPERSCPAGKVPDSLWRPLAFPSVAAGTPCPVSRPHSVTHRIAPVLGSGPVYFAAGAYNAADRSTMLVNDGPGSWAAGTGWGVAKAPIVKRKTFRQPLLLRGGRLDGTGELGFSGHGHRPFAALQLWSRVRDAPIGKFQSIGLAAWAVNSGCYALQIDGRTFSEVIVFRVAAR
jgi:hypothetical protein